MVLTRVHATRSIATPVPGASWQGHVRDANQVAAKLHEIWRDYGAARIRKTINMICAIVQFCSIVDNARFLNNTSELSRLSFQSDGDQMRSGEVRLQDGGTWAIADAGNRSNETVEV